MNRPISGHEVGEIIHEILTMAVEDESILEAIGEKFECTTDEVRDIVERAQLHADSITI